MTITLDRTTPADEQIIRNMFTAFFYDLSQWDDKLIINQYGLPMWEPGGLPGPRTHEECYEFNKWIRDEAIRYIVRVDGVPAGYALIITNKAHLPAGVDFDLFDFYIVPKYRRKGVGWQAAQMVFEQHHGAWEVFYLHPNLPAKAFWDRLVDHYMGGQYQDVSDDRGVGKRFRN